MSEKIDGDYPRVPVVSLDTIGSAVGTMREIGEQYYATVGEKLMAEQPELNDHLSRHIGMYARTEGEAAKMIEIALFMYDVFSRQAEADAMNQQLGETQ